MDDCLSRARALAARLSAEGKKPWIGILRDVQETAAGRYHAPLIPRGFSGLPQVPAWTTHYVCCCDGYAYDPLLDDPEPLETYAVRLFGREIAITAME
jgi:hypothetical protein